MKRLLTTILILAAVGAGIFLLGSPLLEMLARRGLERVSHSLATKGIDIDSLSFSRLRLRSFRSASLDDVYLNFRLQREFFGQRTFRSEFRAKRVLIRISSFREPSIMGILENFSLDLQYDMEDSSARSPYGRFENARFETVAAIDLSNPTGSLQELTEGLRSLFRENTASIPIMLSGTVFFSFGGNTASARLFTDQENGRTKLRFDPDDLIRAAEAFEVELIPDEAELIAAYPVQVPALIRITRNAELSAEMASMHRPGFPQDAWKHLYWSYQLTLAFGPEFAQLVTDAHELKPNNTPEEREMDYHNNSMGREYALQGLTEAELLKKALHAPEVIRSPHSLVH